MLELKLQYVFFYPQFKTKGVKSIKTDIKSTGTHNYHYLISTYYQTITTITTTNNKNRKLRSPTIP